MTGRGRPGASGPLDGADGAPFTSKFAATSWIPSRVFDRPVPATTAGQRRETSVPAQALTMMNDPFVHEQAEALRTAPNRSGQIQTIVFARWCSFVLVDHLHLKSKPFWSHSTRPTSLTSCSTPKPSCTGTSAMTHCGKFKTGPITRRDMLARGAAGLPAQFCPRCCQRTRSREASRGLLVRMASDSNTTPPKPAV